MGVNGVPRSDRERTEPPPVRLDAMFRRRPLVSYEPARFEAPCGEPFYTEADLQGHLLLCEGCEWRSRAAKAEAIVARVEALRAYGPVVAWRFIEAALRGTEPETSDG